MSSQRQFFFHSNFMSFICQLLRQQLSFWTMIALWSQKRSNRHGKTDKLQWSRQIACPTCPKKILYKFKVMKRASREYPWVQSAPQHLQAVSLRPSVFREDQMQRLETKQNIRVASTAFLLLVWLFEWLQKERPVCAGFVVRPTANSSVHPTDWFTDSSISCRKATMKLVQKDQQSLSLRESMFQLVRRGGFFSQGQTAAKEQLPPLPVSSHLALKNSWSLPPNTETFKWNS